MSWSVTQKGVANGSVALTSADRRDNSLFLRLRLRLLPTLTKMQIILNASSQDFLSSWLGKSVLFFVGEGCFDCS